jgi:hypothetical protein
MPRKGGPVRKSKIPGVKSVIVVASGKGGVGKSTVSGKSTQEPPTSAYDTDSVEILTWPLLAFPS